MIQISEDIIHFLRNHSQLTRTVITLTTIVGGCSIIITTLILTALVVTCIYRFGLARLLPNDLRKRYGNWAIISGATDGIGLAFATELAKRGHSLIILGRSDLKLANVKDKLMAVSKSTDEVMTINLDLAHATIADFERLKEQIDVENRPIGILINNAGVCPTELKRFINRDTEELREMLAVNVNSVVMLTRFIMPKMVEQNRGLVVNVSSGLGLFETPYLSIYSATKAFIYAFSRALRLDYSKHNIDIVALTPGPVCTKLINGWTDTFRSSRQRLISPSPDVYVRSALAAIPASFADTAGYFPHAFVQLSAKLFNLIGVTSFFLQNFTLIIAKKTKLSPVPMRKYVDDTA